MTPGTRRRLPLVTIFLLLHGAGWLSIMAIVTITSASHVPPSELWTALPLGVSAILVAFRGNGDRHHPPPQHERRED